MKLAIVVVLFLGTATGFSLNNLRNQEEPMVDQKENVAKSTDSCNGKDVMGKVACHNMDQNMEICTSPDFYNFATCAAIFVLKKKKGNCLLVEKDFN